jgi:hypothetical protein
MGSANPLQGGRSPQEQLYSLGRLLEQALMDSNELHHRIREIQLRVAELSASLESGRLAGVARADG